MILDLMFFGLIVVFTVLGFVFGFFKTLVSFFGWFVSLLLSYLLAKAIANAVLSANVAGWLVGDGSIFDKVYGIVPDGLKNISLESIRNDIANGYTEEQIREGIRAQSSGILFFASSLIQDAVCKEIYLNSAIANVGQVLALELTYHIFVIIVGVVFFVVLRVVIMGLSLIFKTKLAGHKVKFVERILGIGLGAIRGFAYACFLVMIAGYLAGFVGFVNEQVDGSKVSVPVSTWVSDTTGKMLSDDLEQNENYRIMIDALGERITEEQIDEGAQSQE